MDHPNRRMSESSATASEIIWTQRAQALLDGRPLTPENLTFHSYLLRHQNRFAEEAALLGKARELGISSAYLEEREAWHALPRFDRLVPRAPLELPKEDETKPGQDVLEQLCIVTALGSDAPYYQVGVELIESIKNTRDYKDIPIAIIDSGLTDDDRHYLLTRFNNLIIRDPGLDVDIALPERDFKGTKRSADGLKGSLARPFIPKHFPGYRYYLWFDTDVWVQDERSMDLFLSNAVKQGVCSVVTPDVATDFRFKDGWWHRECLQHPLVPEHHLPTLLESPSISAGTFCIDVKSGFFDLWGGYMKESVEYGGHIWGPDELTYMITRQRHFPQTPILGFRHNFAPVAMSYGMPIFGKSCLLTPYSAEPIGIIHFCGMRKNQWFAQLIESEEPVDIEHNIAGGGTRRQHGIHFRIWPWQDKPEILAYLQAHLEGIPSHLPA